MIFSQGVITREFVIATRNLKKVEEIRRILSKGNDDLRFLTLKDYPDFPEVEEDRETFKDNAAKKALAIAQYTGKIAIADDSGLEVYALGGSPGVHSARYAGDNASDRSNNDKLLQEMESIDDRGARFVCVVALAKQDGSVMTFEGFVEGSIARKLRGNMGFGYDPLFIPKGWSKSFGEALPEEKDALSHRAKALKKLKDYIDNNDYL